MTEGTSVATPVATAENVRPHCQKPKACHAKTPGKHCYSCASNNPEAKARRSASISAAQRNPEVKARHRAACKAAALRRMADPVQAERLRHLGRTVGVANLIRAATPQILEERGSAIRAAHLAWCPERYWELNAKLKANGYRLNERKMMIGAEVALEGRREVEANARAMREKHQRDLASRY